LLLKLLRPTKSPMGIPKTIEMITAIPETFKVSKIISYISLFPENIRRNALFMPCHIMSIIYLFNLIYLCLFYNIRIKQRYAIFCNTVFFYDFLPLGTGYKFYKSCCALIIYFKVGIFGRVDCDNAIRVK
jgi:hypothetical protein